LNQSSLKTCVALTLLATTLTVQNRVSANELMPSGVNAEINSVESGLRGAVRFEGDPKWNIKDRMEFYGVPGVSIAVIKDYKIHWVKHYGVTDRETNQPVNDKTLFQAGSISKPVAAYGALKLVEQKKLSLDKPANQYLKGWQIPDNDFTRETPVALKHLLNHSAGLTVHGFWGYSDGLPVPNVIQVLNGEKPANSSAVVVNLAPETQMRYSGGGYTVMQKMVSDAMGTDFPTALQKLVIDPIGMKQSTYEQPLPADKLKFAAAGYLPNKKAVPGKRHVYPEMAAAGLWTTAEDLAKFAIDVQMGIKSNKSQVLSNSMANKMLTPWVSKNVGLGFFIDTKKHGAYFGHGGWDEGFSADLIAHKNKGYGVAIMTNSNHPAFIEELKNAVASTYQWQEYIQPDFSSLDISDSELQRISGRYFFNPDMLFTISKQDDKVMMSYLDGNEMQIHRIAENLYVRREQNRKFSFVKNPKSQQVELVFDMGHGETISRRQLAKGEVIPFEAVVNGNLDAAEKQYKAMFKDQPEMKEQVEWNLLNLAESLADKKSFEQTKQLLELNTRLFDQSITSWEKLGQLHLAMSNKELAIGSYKKVLAIQPEHKVAIEALKKLTSK
jgi:CubicO group peptidase (beta-lactamase class C family)